MNKNWKKPGIVAVLLIAVVTLSAIIVQTLSSRHRAAVTAEHLEECEMLVWTNYYSMDGANKLVLWRDGRSEVWVYPSDAEHRTYTLTANPDWEATVDKTSDQLVPQDATAYVQRNIIEKEDAIHRFQEAIAAGIHFLRRVEPDYLDGGGVKVGVMMDGELRETLIASESRSFSGENRRIFDAVSAIMNTYDRDAYSRKKPVRLPLSAVDATTWKDSEGSHGPAIAKAYEDYKGDFIEVVGFRLDPQSFIPPQEAVGMQNGLGSSPEVGGTQPVRLGHDFVVPLTGSLPPKHGEKYVVTGMITTVNNKGDLGIEVQYWRKSQE